MENQRRGGGHYNLRQLARVSFGSGISLTRGNFSKRKRRSSKEEKVINPCDLRLWAELPEELLDIILKRLSIVDYLSFGRVCQRWRSTFMFSRKNFLASIPPLVILIATRGKKTCFFFNFTDGKRYKTKLPLFAGKFCIGISSGFMIMDGYNGGFWCTNPVTGQELGLPKPFPQSNWIHLSDRNILASTIPQEDFLVVGISAMNSQLHFRRVKDAGWTILADQPRTWGFLDVAFFELKVYALCSNWNIGVLSLRSPSTLTLLTLKGKPTLTNHAKFVTSEEKLLVVDFVPHRWLQVYWINFVGMEWVKVTDLGDEALFMADMKCSRLLKPTLWGGDSNCLYHLSFMSQVIVVYALNGTVLHYIPIQKGDTENSPRFTFGWYVPQQSYFMDVVWDDKFGPLEA